MLEIGKNILVWDCVERTKSWLVNIGAAAGEAATALPNFQHILTVRALGGAVS